MTVTAPAGAPPRFEARFRAEFETLLRWRRDVRRFRRDPLDAGLVAEILRLADLSPSVGNSQPWRLVLVESAPARAVVEASFEAENTRAAGAYAEDRAALYARLKLAGLREAPVHLAVFCDPDPVQGQGLGRATMPATLAHSVAGMVQALWLAARMLGVGVGWVSILDPQAVHRALDVPPNWELVAYLCLGYPVEEHVDPELEREGWQARTPLSERLFIR
ncbi:5,6-dimethylbenzimidazole synthase [Microvirga tunisiensis]|uniref:5,6-dimethylbenzimidazole synthase n=2 Tax=Pannonibacter tanglangensis TaxID=2750084 RepID=A0ABW9ZFP5_9HYPH|nr:MULTISPECIES: 5,6-dimethylbenzimidazole synthase [unclassified Pannonibacter]NBN63249.1 5,6-dimethylbenzimidazole synthase [Pannonibacter sp. XCT-34]NBN76887.1 5,6-dimethylbenzimidazole synthase [Pannonibacter sp. XCT-53]